MTTGAATESDKKTSEASSLITLLTTPFRYTLFNIVFLNIIALGLAYLIIPDTVHLLFNKLVRSIERYRFNRLYIIFINLGLCFAVEIFFLGWKKSSLYRLLSPSKSAKTDLIVAGYHILGFGWIVAAFFSFGTSFYIEEIFEEHLDYKLLQWVSYPFLQYMLWLIALDFLDYWYHRLMHSVGFLWEAHKYHHAALEFNVITGNRNHALEEVTRTFIHVVPMALLGAPLETYIAVKLARKAIDTYQHSMLPWDFGWVGRWIIYSPVGHRIHHSKEEEHWDLNFGNISPIWDRMFGTWYDGDNVNEEIGVTDNVYNKGGIIEEYLMCFQLTFSTLWRSIKTGEWRPQPSGKQ